MPPRPFQTKALITQKKPTTMDIFKSFGVDPEAEVDGRWISIGDAKVKIARIGAPNKKFTQLMHDLIKKDHAVWQPDIRPDVSDTPEIQRKKQEIAAKRIELSSKNLIEALVECIILDWDNIQVDGEQVKYSKDKCRELMNDPKLRPFREWICAEAESERNFRLKAHKEDEEALKKN